MSALSGHGKVLGGGGADDFAEGAPADTSAAWRCASVADANWRTARGVPFGEMSIPRLPTPTSVNPAVEAIMSADRNLPRDVGSVGSSNAQMFVDASGKGSADACSVSAGWDLAAPAVSSFLLPALLMELVRYFSMKSMTLLVATSFITHVLRLCLLAFPVKLQCRI